MRLSQIVRRASVIDARMTSPRFQQEGLRFIRTKGMDPRDPVFQAFVHRVRYDKYPKGIAPDVKKKIDALWAEWQKARAR